MSILQSDNAAWLAARVGKVTASRVADVIAKTKTGVSASRANYLAELVAERLTGTPAANFTNAAMQWGLDTEPHAKGAYEFFHDATVLAAAVVDHPTIPFSAATPDGFVGEDGLVEFKCPNTATHIDTLLGGGVPTKYITQMQWQMACTSRAWCDFVSFDPRLPETMRLFSKRVHRDNRMIGELEGEVRTFLEDVASTVSQIQERYGTP